MLDALPRTAFSLLAGSSAMTMWKVAAVVITIGAAGLTAVLYAGFGAFLPWRENAEADRLADLVGIQEGQTVAEVGAGGGRFSRITHTATTTAQ